MTEAKPTTSRWPLVRAILRTGNRAGLTAAQGWALLAILDHLPNVEAGLSKLAAEAGVERTTVHRMVKLLERAEIIESHQARDDAGDYAVTKRRFIIDLSNHEAVGAAVERLARCTVATRTTPASALHHSNGGSCTTATGVVAAVQHKAKQGKQSKGSKASRAASTPLPPVLDTEAFRVTWNEWTTHRTQARKPLTPTAATKQLAKLEAMGIERAIAAINHSLANGWRGVYEPKETTHGRNQPDPATRRAEQLARQHPEPAITVREI